MTPAEKILWRELRGRKFHGMKFRRQHPAAGYILDYYCHESKLGIELDGEIHNQTDISEYDKKRTEELVALSLRVIRFYKR
jgi:very-short-patch-repair endonuclease